MSNASTFESVESALSQHRFETARRLCLAALPKTDPADRFALQCLLHEAYRWLGDFAAATALVESMESRDAQQQLEKTILLAKDYAKLSDYGYYRDSTEAKTGLSVDEYSEKMKGISSNYFQRAIESATSPELRVRVADALRSCNRKAEADRLSPTKPLTAPSIPVPTEFGVIAGTVRTKAGRPVVGITVSLGLCTVAPVNPPVQNYFSPEMHYGPDLGQQALRKCVTDASGRFSFDRVPAGEHEFLAVTTGEDTPGLMTQFLAQPVRCDANSTRTYDLVHRTWQSAAAAPAVYEFAESMEQGGRTYRRVGQQRFTNPFAYHFPRQKVALTLGQQSTESLIVRASDQPTKALPHQVIDGAVHFMLDLPELSERVVAIYQPLDRAPAEVSASRLKIKPEEGGASAIVDTGPAQFRIPWGSGVDSVAPIQGVRGADGQWRGQGRWRLPSSLAIKSWQASQIVAGPLIVRVKIDYQMSDGATLSFLLEAQEGEAYLLVHETSSPYAGAFEFSLREFSNGRGFIHWTPEHGNVHWTTLQANDRIVGRLLESVPWWWNPDGFAYAMTADGLTQKDYIGVFTIRRGEWIDRAFEAISQGPGDEPAWRRELDWPFPEMVGSTLSMITAHTDATGDAFFRFNGFDGERHWGVLASTLDANDGHVKEIALVQHKNSSPRLQDLKDWHLDEPDELPRPNHIVSGDQLVELRRKSKSPRMAELWNRITSGKSHGAADALRFAVEGDPLIAWRKKKYLVGVAPFRSRMTLLGRDAADMYSPVGARPITHWAEEFDLIVGSGVFTPEEEWLTRAFLLLMGHLFLSGDLMNWKYGGRNANFEADRVDVVGAVGMVFHRNPAGAMMVQHAIERSQAALRTYCTPGSGKWYENPACYYLHASKCRMNLLINLVRKGLIEIDQIERLREFLNWGIFLLTPPQPEAYEQMVKGLSDEAYAPAAKSRVVPPIGDHAVVGRPVPDHYALASVIFRDVDPPFADRLLSAWQYGGKGGEPYSNAPLLFTMLDETHLAPAPPLELHSRRLEGFGAVFRSHVNENGENYLLFKQGPGGYRYHRTEGSILLFADGKPLIYDGGEAGETWRHTTLSFYDTHMPMAAGHVERFFASSVLDFCQGVHPTAIKPGDPVFMSDNCHHELVQVALDRYHEPNPAIQRTAMWVKDEYAILHDDLQLDASIPHHWHLQAVADSHTGDWKSGYRFAGRFGTDLQVLLPGQSFADEKIEQVSTLEYKLTPAESFSMRHVQLRGKGRHYTAVIRPLGNGRAAVESKLLLVDESATVLAVTGEKIDDLLFLNRSAGSVTANGCTFSGRYGFVLRRSDGLHLVVVDGQSLHTDQWRLEVTDGPVAVHIRPDGSHSAEGSGRFQLTKRS